MSTVPPILRGLLRASKPRFRAKPRTTTASSSSSSSSSSPSKTTTATTATTSTSTKTAPPKTPPPQPAGRPSWLGHPFRVLVSTLKFVAFAHLVWDRGVSMAPATGPSMLPTFEVLGEWLVVSKRERFGRGLAVGDVVAYSIPINDEVGVKRVLGLPGDYVLMDTPDGAGGGTGSMIQVPQGHCWIVGDNLAASRDSRHFGPVPLALIRGKVIATVRSFSDIRWITNPLQKVDGPSES